MVILSTFKLGFNGDTDHGLMDGGESHTKRRGCPWRLGCGSVMA
jgi:hypothetical protein